MALFARESVTHSMNGHPRNSFQHYGPEPSTHGYAQVQLPSFANFIGSEAESNVPTIGHIPSPVYALPMLQIPSGIHGPVMPVVVPTYSPPTFSPSPYPLHWNPVTHPQQVAFGSTEQQFQSQHFIVQLRDPFVPRQDAPRLQPPVQQAYAVPIPAATEPSPHHQVRPAPSTWHPPIEGISSSSLSLKPMLNSEEIDTSAVVESRNVIDTTKAAIDITIANNGNGTQVRPNSSEEKVRAQSHRQRKRSKSGKVAKKPRSISAAAAPEKPVPAPPRRMNKLLQRKIESMTEEERHADLPRDLNDFNDSFMSFLTQRSTEETLANEYRYTGVYWSKLRQKVFLEGCQQFIRERGIDEIEQHHHEELRMSILERLGHVFKSYELTLGETARGLDAVKDNLV